MRKAAIVLSLVLAFFAGRAGVDYVRDATAAQAYQRTVISSTYFSPTTSAQLAGVLSDETGTGSVVFSASPTLTGTANFASLTSSATLTFTTSASAGSTTSQGVMFKNSATGLSLKASTGSQYDFALTDPPNNVYIARVPTGSQDFEFVGGIRRGLTTQTGATYTVAATDTHVIANRAGTVTLTLGTANAGRELTVRTIQAQTVVSASSNVVPCAGGAAGTAILAATAGKWATLVGDGSNWQIQACN